MTPIYVIARSAATRQSIFRWCKTKAGLLRLRLAMTLIPVIARSETTWQSTPTPSLRGVKRRGNLFFRWCKTKAGLLRLWLAMTLIPVIARSETTWQSIFRWCKTKAGLLRLRLAMTVGRLAITVGMVRNDRSRFVIARSETTWQSIWQVVRNDRWIASPSARNDSGDGSQ